jgi:isopropylmalate/homocitrate/citramalate synthase
MLHLKNIYPKCANSFKTWYTQNIKYKKVYSFLGEPTPFDVTLRDGLQSLSIIEQENFSTNDKMDIYHRIHFNYKPKNIEVGSIVSEKVLPIFKDSQQLFDRINGYQKAIYSNPNENQSRQNVYILIPTREKLNAVINNTDMNYFSFITSVSNSFQLKNMKMTLAQSDYEIHSMLDDLKFNTLRTIPPVIKLYVSCINQCPIEGKIDNDYIVNRLLKINNNFNVNSICLSDTCGTLSFDDFEYIIDTCDYFGLPKNKFSLHLHVKKGREDEIEKIIHFALDKKIVDFDVSCLESGGCSVTMDKDKLCPNLSYELYYKALCKYIIKRSD